MASDRDEAFSTAVDLLRKHGPLSEEEWIDLLVQHDIDEQTATEIVEDGGHHAVLLLDDRLVLIDDLVEQRHFTHRLTADEIAADMLFDTVDLYPMTGRVLGFTVTAATDPEVFAERGVDPAPDLPGIVLERGTLGAFQPGTLVEVAIRLNADPNKAESRAHLLALEARRVSLGLPVADIEITPVDAAAEIDVTEALEEARVAGGDELIYFDTLVWHLLVTQGLFTEPTVPLSELIDDAGYHVSGDFVARAGTDVDDVLNRQRTARIRTQYDLPSAHAADVALTLGRLAGLSDADQHALIAKRLQASPHYFDVLGDDMVPMPVAEVVFERVTAAREISDENAASTIAGFRRATALLLHQVSNSRAKSAIAYLAARAAFADRDLAAAEALVHDSLHDDRDSPASKLLMSSLALLRDDVEKANSLLIEVGIHDTHPLRLALTTVLSETGPEPGRNEPCWCGSGRKFKSCHRGKPRITDEQRSELLGLKAMDYLIWSGRLADVDRLHDLRLSFITDPTLHEQFADDQELAIDVLLLEGGVYTEMLDAARDHLPPEDIALIEGILERGRSVYEIVDVDPGVGMILRDLRDDLRYPLIEETASRTLRLGTFLCARLTPHRDGFIVTITPDVVSGRDAPLLCEALVEGMPPTELIAMLSLPFAQTGALIDDVVAHGAHLASVRLTQPEAVRSWLTENLVPADGGWMLVDDGDLAGEVRLEEDDNVTSATIIAFSDEILQLTITSIADVDPDATVVDERHLTGVELADELEALAEPKGPHLKVVDD